MSINLLRLSYYIVFVLLSSLSIYQFSFYLFPVCFTPYRCFLFIRDFHFQITPGQSGFVAARGEQCWDPVPTSDSRFPGDKVHHSTGAKFYANFVPTNRDWKMANLMPGTRTLCSVDYFNQVSNIYEYQKWLFTL